MAFVELWRYCLVCHPILRVSQVVVGDAAEWQTAEGTWKFLSSTVLDVSLVGNTRRIVQVGYPPLKLAFYKSSPDIHSISIKVGVPVSLQLTNLI